MKTLLQNIDDTYACQDGSGYVIMGLMVITLLLVTLFYGLPFIV